MQRSAFLLCVLAVFWGAATAVVTRGSRSLRDTTAVSYVYSPKDDRQDARSQSMLIAQHVKDRSVDEVLIQAASNRSLPPPILPTVDHKKTAGGGYAPGSPYYAEQQARGDVPPPQPPSMAKYGAAMTFKNYVIASAIYVVLVILVAIIHRHFQQAGRAVHEVHAYEGDAFTFGFCDPHCSQDYPICLMAICCPWVRWSETVSHPKVRFLSFWLALALMLTLELLAPFVYGITGCILVGVGVYHRQQLRQAFGHVGSPVKTGCLDIFAWICCAPCAIAQEAREVEKVRRKH